MAPESLLTLVVIISCLLVGLSKGGLSPALAVVIAPLMAAVMPVRSALSLALPMLIIGDIFALYFYWRKWDMRYVRLLLLPAIIGIVVGAFVLANLPDQAVRQMMGAFVLLFIVYKLIEPRLRRLRYTPRGWHGLVAGSVAGAGSMIANVGGPPYTVYMLLQPDVTPLSFNGTATLLFAIINLVKLPFLGLANIFDINDLLQNAWALPFIPLGVLVGRFLVTRIDRRALDGVMLGALVLSAVVLIFVPPTA